MLVLDTSVAIHLRDGDAEMSRKLRTAGDDMALSIVTLVELQAGLASTDGDVRRDRLDVLLETLPVLAFTQRDAAAYGEIVSATGYSRRKVLDRMIAAQALAANATVATLNPADFRDIPGLQLLEW